MIINWHCVTFQQLHLQDLYELLTLRQLVFVVEQNCPYLDTDGKDLKAWHLLGRDEKGDLVAYTRLLPVGVSYPSETSIGRVVIAPNARKKGIGKILMLQSIQETKRLFGNVDNRIGAQHYLVSFYESLGYQVASEVYLEDGIPHIEMVRRMDD